MKFDVDAPKLLFRQLIEQLLLEQPFHWSIAGPLLLTMIFEGSTRFTEQISKSTYPSYGDYQAVTSRSMPMPPNKGARA